MHPSVPTSPRASSGPRPLRAGLAVAAVLTGCAWMAESAAAQQGTSCRGSATRYEEPARATSEPVVANTNRDPCVTDAASSARTEPQGGFTATNPRANTNRSAGLITAFAAVESVSGGSGSTPITVGAVESSQAVACQAGRSVASGSSRVDDVRVNGAPVPVASGDQPSDTTVPTLNGDLRIRTNQVTSGPEGILRTALILESNGTRYTVGEVIAGGDACLALPSGTPGAGAGGGGGAGNGGTGNGGNGGSGNGGTGGGGGGSNLGQVCPTGAVLDTARTLCVIRGRDGSVVVVGAPFQGPNGGSVISLTEARSQAASGKLAASACLKGSGPNYVVVGTKGNDNITGTNARDRILGLAGRDRIDGGRGDDCLDGGTSRDVLSGALGRDRVIGGQGNDALNGGAATDHLSGGSGNDSINAAFGRDVVAGGGGRDSINVATAGPSARVNCGSGRDTVRGNRNERRRVRGCERRYFMR